MQVKFDLQHFCCGPKGCEIEIEYGEMIDAQFIFFKFNFFNFLFHNVV